MDIFPLDGTGNEYTESVDYYNKIKAGYNLFMAKVAALNRRRSLLKNIAILLARIIPDPFISIRKIRVELDQKASQKDFDRSIYGGNIFGNWGLKEIMETSIMGNPKEYEFNGILVYGVERYDEYLSHLYGNWRELPPEDKSCSIHSFLLLCSLTRALYSGLEIKSPARRRDELRAPA